jgi:hypothetical protein
MKRAMTLAAAITVVVASVSAQAPNFSGKWTLVPDANTPPAGGMGAAPSVTIVQDAATLTQTRTTGMGEFTTTHKLDGTESKNTLNFNGNAVEQLSTTKIEGGKLTISTTMSFDGNPIQMSTVMSLDPSGHLIIESTRPDFQGGGAPITTKATYKKN